MNADEKPHWIGGTWSSGSGAPFSSLDPGNGELLWSGSAADTSDVHGAVEAARTAQPDWSGLSVAERATCLEGFATALEKRRDAFALALSDEMGKPRWESQTEVGAMLGKIRFTLQAYEERQSPVVSETSATRYKPHGVAVVLGPFNLPGHLPNAHIAPALLAGNTIVFKPSEQTPLVGRLLTEIWTEAGLPSGVFNLVQGELATGKALVEHPDIDAIFFTGSFGAGRAIAKARIDNPGVIVALEMGGNNPLVVWEPCDVDAAAYQIIQSAFITSGQRCVCARRLIVPDGRFGDAVLARLIEMTGKLRFDDHRSEPEPFFGPVISAQAALQILEAAEDLRERGASSLLEMEQRNAAGTLLSPGILEVTGVSNLPDREIFGPLLQVVRVPDFESAIAEANRTQFGLSAGLLCENAADWEQFFRHARAGIVNWNRPITGASGAQPFGGIGQSGNHRPCGYFAVDYCSYPVASTMGATLERPKELAPGISW